MIQKFIKRTLGIGVGLSVGRKGHYIQLGAMTAQFMNQIAKLSKMEEKYLQRIRHWISTAFKAP